jgi:hypothetical protein
MVFFDTNISGVRSGDKKGGSEFTLAKKFITQNLCEDDQPREKFIS